jgi:hypothetical protein
VSGSDTKLHLLKVSRYEHVASVLLAMLISLGSFVLVTLIAWLASRNYTSQVAVPVKMEQIGDQEEAPWGPGNDIEPPPGGGGDTTEEEPEQVLNAVADSVTSRAAMLEETVLGGAGQGGPDEGGIGPGGGKGRGGGGTGRGRQGKPRRWEVMFDKGLTLEAYAQQLDYFGIELGVLRPNNQVEYAFNLARTRPSSRKGAADQEKRYYLTWKKGDLQQADRTLLSRAGVQVGRSLILKFLKPETEQEIYALEQAHANGRKVRATVFGVRKGNKKPYEFYVIRQTNE